MKVDAAFETVSRLSTKVSILREKCTKWSASSAKASGKDFRSWMRHTLRKIYILFNSLQLLHSPLTDSSYHFDSVGRLVTQRQVHTMTSTLVYCNNVDVRDNVSHTIETHTYYKIAMLLIRTTISAYLSLSPFLSFPPWSFKRLQLQHTPLTDSCYHSDDVRRLVTQRYIKWHRHSNKVIVR